MSRTPLVYTVAAALGVAMGCSQTQTPPRKPAAAATARPAAAAPQALPATPAQPATPAPTAAPATAAAPSSLDELRTALAAGGDEQQRVATIDAIADLGQGASPALADLIKATEDAEPRVRWHAARAIGLIGEDAVSAVPLLVGLLSDSDPIVASQAAAAIGLIRADESVTTITPEDAGRYSAAFPALAKAFDQLALCG